MCVEPTISASSSTLSFGLASAQQEERGAAGFDGLPSRFYYAVFEGVTLNIDPAAPKLVNNRHAAPALCRMNTGRQNSLCLVYSSDDIADDAEGFDDNI